jgi:DnaJ-class molecular chaperone
MADLYSVLGTTRGASDADIKKAYRKLAKELHPDRNKDNPAALERFKQVSAAYAILSDKDQRGRYDRGEIDESGNPKGFGFGGGGGFGGGAGGYGGGGFEGFSGRQQAGGGFEFDASDLFSELFGRGRGRTGGFGAGGPRTAPKGADVAYRLAVPFEAAARLDPQRVTLRNGKTVDRPVSKPGGRCGWPDRASPARAARATRWSRSKSRRTASSPATATMSASRCRSGSTRRCSAARSRYRPSTARCSSPFPLARPRARPSA